MAMAQGAGNLARGRSPHSRNTALHTKILMSVQARPEQEDGHNEGDVYEDEGIPLKLYIGTKCGIEDSKTDSFDRGDG